MLQGVRTGFQDPDTITAETWPHGQMETRARSKDREVPVCQVDQQICNRIGHPNARRHVRTKQLSQGHLHTTQ